MGKIRNGHGKPIPCCWRDCWEDASTDHQAVVPHDAPERRGDTLTYTFCSAEHQARWVASSVQHGELGISPGRRSGSGLILP